MKTFQQIQRQRETSTIGINRFQIVETLASVQNLLKEPRRRSVIMVLKFPMLWQFQACHLFNQNRQKSSATESKWWRAPNFFVCAIQCFPTNFLSHYFSTNLENTKKLIQLIKKVRIPLKSDNKRLTNLYKRMISIF